MWAQAAGDGERLVPVEVEDVNVNLVLEVLMGVNVEVVEVHANMVDEVEVLAVRDVLVNVDVLDFIVFGDHVPELIDADVVEDVGAFIEVLGGIGIVDLAVLAVEVDDGLVFNDVLVNVDVVDFIMFGDNV
eukprot:370636-Amphidinium_carterae.1